jgi:condensin complex subunit 1
MENLQSPTIRPQQRKILKDHLCHILGIMIKKFNHSYGACVMIIQTLPHYEHFSTLYADLIQTCVTQLSYESILPDLLREFHHTNLSSGSSDSNKENPNLKFYSQFLVDLADRLAQHLLPYLSLIQDLLDEESYLMRNSILYIYGEIIIRVLNQEACSNDLKQKQMRNELLDELVDHIHDSNALTRSKTLQIWRRICEENAMPLSYMNEIMKRCVGRMQDTASSVRKSAFQLLCDLIRKNPYGIKSIEMSIEQVEVECAKEEAALLKLSEESDKLIENLNMLAERAKDGGQVMWIEIEIFLFLKF